MARMIFKAGQQSKREDTWSKKKYLNFYYDFETSKPLLDKEGLENFTSLELFRRKEEIFVKVISWCVCTGYLNPKFFSENFVTIEKNGVYYTYGLNIEYFMEFLENFEGKNITMYALNSSGFDLHYVVPRLKEWLYVPHDEDCRGIKCWKTNHDGEFNVKTGIGKNILFLDLWNGYGSKITFFDLFRITNKSVAAMGESIGLLKLDGNQVYDRLEYESISQLETINSGNDLQYLIRDVEIIYSYHTGFINSMNEIKVKLPIKPTITGSCFKLLQVDDKFKPQEKHNCFETEWLEKKYEDNISYFSYFRRWYRGGITLVNDIYKGFIVKYHFSLDINSSYPSVMASDCLIPVGEPTEVKDDTEFGYYYYEIISTKELKSSCNINFIPWRVPKKTGRIYSPIPEDTVLHLETPEWNLFNKYYNNDYEVLRIWKFNCVKAKEIFGNYVYFFYTYKNSENKFIRDIAKLALNSIYGKFGENIEGTDHYWDFTLNDWNKRKYEDRKPNYLPFASSITSWARKKLLDVILRDDVLDKFIYCDTDSVKILGKDSSFLNDIIDSKKIGFWKDEGHYLEGIYRMKKQYATLRKLNDDEIKKLKNKKFLQKDKLLEIKIAGFNMNRVKGLLVSNNWKDNKELSVKDFKEHLVIDNQLKSFKGKNGSILYHSVKEVESV